MGRNVSSNAVGLVPKNFLISENAQKSPRAAVPSFSSSLSTSERRSSMIVRPRGRGATLNNTPALPNSDMVNALDDANESGFNRNSVSSASLWSPNSPNEAVPMQKEKHSSPDIAQLSLKPEPKRKYLLEDYPPPPKMEPGVTPVPDDIKLQEIKKKFEFITSRRQSRALAASNIGNLKMSIVGDSGIGKVNFE